MDKLFDTISGYVKIPLEKAKNYNEYTKIAFKGINTDEDFKKLCLEFLEKQAKENNKDIKDISLLDIHRAFSKVNKEFPNFLNRITLKRLDNIKDLSDFSSFISLFLSFINPYFLVWPSN